MVEDAMRGSSSAKTKAPNFSTSIRIADSSTPVVRKDALGCTTAKELVILKVPAEQATDGSKRQCSRNRLYLSRLLEKS